MAYTGGMIEMHCLISGKVQGVGYRAFVQDAASERKLGGFARNLEGGQVEVVAQGDPAALKELVECLHEGSALSLVEAVAVEWRSARERYDDFSLSF